MLKLKEFRDILQLDAKYFTPVINDQKTGMKSEQRMSERNFP